MRDGLILSLFRDLFTIAPLQCTIVSITPKLEKILTTTTATCRTVLTVGTVSMPTKAVTAEEEEELVVLQQEDMRRPVTAVAVTAAAQVMAAVLPIQPQRHKEVLMVLNMEPTVELQMRIR